MSNISVKYIKGFLPSTYKLDAIIKDGEILISFENTNFSDIEIIAILATELEATKKRMIDKTKNNKLNKN
jgi:hypothetical protein